MASTSTLAAISTELADLIETASSFVVSVDARRRRPASGIIIRNELVVTADHVIEREDVLVRQGERRLPAEIAGRDPASDIAVVRVPGLAGTSAPRGGEPRVGQLVVSIARAANGHISAATGVVNALSGPVRTGVGVALTQVIRSDAAARPGVSGGAIVDTSGGVLGMTTAALLRGLPVGIPVGQLLDIAAALASGTPFKRAYLGVSVQHVIFPRPGPDGTEGGLLVFGVARDSAADRAGVVVGDVVVGFDAARIAYQDDLQDALAAAGAGAQATLSVIRGGAVQRVAVTLGARPSA